MAWTYEQKFNDLTDGNLVGQDNWVHTFYAYWQVVSTGTPYEGTKYLTIDEDGQMTREIAAVNSGIFYFSVKWVYPNGGYGRIYMLNGTTSSFYLAFSTTGDATIYDADSATQKVVASPSSDTWVRIGFEFDCSTDEYRFNTDGGTWSIWYGIQTPVTDIDKIQITTQSATDAAVSFDYISPYYEEKYSNVWTDSSKMTIDNTKVGA